MCIQLSFSQHDGFLLFHGMRANNKPIPHQSVTPAKINPAPTNPDRTRRAGCSNQAPTTPTKTSVPAAILTCRSNETPFFPRVRGSPACSQSTTPPSSTVTFSKPAPISFSRACSDRAPLRQIKQTSRPRALSRTASGRSSCSGCSSEPDKCFSSNSTGVRTSTRKTSLRWSNSRGEIFVVS